MRSLPAKALPILVFAMLTSAFAQVPDSDRPSSASFSPQPMPQDTTAVILGTPGASVVVVSVTGGEKCEATEHNSVTEPAVLDAFGRAKVTFVYPLPDKVELCIVEKLPAVGGPAQAAQSTSVTSNVVSVGEESLEITPRPIAGDTTVTVKGTPSPSGTGKPVYLVTLGQLNSEASRDEARSTFRRAQCDPAQTVAISPAQGTKNPAATDDKGLVTFTLAKALAAGTRLCALQDLQANSATPPTAPADQPNEGTVSESTAEHAGASASNAGTQKQSKATADQQTAESLGTAGESKITAVEDPLDWGRARAYFAAGILFANDNSAFSSAHQFYSFDYDKAWRLPDYYLCGAPAESHSPVWFKGGWPGVDSYIEARLTAIPVATNTPATQTAGTTSGNSATSGSSSGSGTANSNSTFLTSQKTANVTAGLYLPFFLTRWVLDGNRYAFSIAPIGKVGFNTLAAPTTQTVPLPNGAGTTTQTFQNVYNFYAVGFRLVNYKLTSEENRQPEVQTYFDIAFGRYSNLASYICRPVAAGHSAETFTGSSCGQYFPAVDGTIRAMDSAKRLYRLDMDGLLEVPKVGAFIGISANIGQRSVGASDLDTAFQPPDDVRFVFGYKTDVASVLKKFGVSTSSN
jgi:hypothetical protein